MKTRWLLLAAVLFAAVYFVPPAASDSPPKDDKEFVYARVRYHMLDWQFDMREVPWHHDYPYGDEAFPTTVGRVTNIDTSPGSYAIVDIDSPDLMKYPFVYLCEPGYLELNERDTTNLREYLDRGGFIMFDDFRGTRAFANLRAELKKVYPDRDLKRLDLSHPIFNSFYKIKTLNVDPPYRTREAGEVEFWGLEDTEGRLQAIIDYNNDLSEFWEWLDRGEMSMHDATTSFEFGINYIMYAMTH